jgi:hypothetical protein
MSAYQVKPLYFPFAGMETPLFVLIWRSRGCPFSPYFPFAGMETLDNSAIYRHKKLLGTIYQNKLACQVVSDPKIMGLKPLRLGISVI